MRFELRVRYCRLVRQHALPVSVMGLVETLEKVDNEHLGEIQALGLPDTQHEHRPLAAEPHHLRERGEVLIRSQHDDGRARQAAAAQHGTQLPAARGECECASVRASARACIMRSNSHLYTSTTAPIKYELIRARYLHYGSIVRVGRGGVERQQCVGRKCILRRQPPEAVAREDGGGQVLQVNESLQRHASVRGMLLGAYGIL